MTDDNKGGQVFTTEYRDRNLALMSEVNPEGPDQLKFWEGRRGVPVIRMQSGRTGEHFDLLTIRQYGQGAPVVVLLAKGQTAQNPSSTKEERQFVGPGVVLYDGLYDRSGLSVTFLQGSVTE